LPVPSHTPFGPQLVDPTSVHWLLGLGAWPAGTFAQVPRLALSAQDWQVAVQAVAQQTPCAQKPELHSPAVAHVMPSGFFEQVPPLQTFGDTQSVLPVHVVLQMLLVVSQLYAPQLELAAAEQVPAPLQVRGGV
jgi:hypothetical protein